MGGRHLDLVEAAIELGVSPRRLSGWEPRTVTEYQYADDGRLLGEVSYREPEWADADLQAVLAVLERRRTVGPHGHPMDEAVSRDGDPSNADRAFDWVVPNPTIDFAAQALSRRKKAYMAKYGEDVDVEALRWRVEKHDLS